MSISNQIKKFQNKIIENKKRNYWKQQKKIMKTTKEIIENNKRNKWKQQKKSPPLLFLLFVMPPPQAGCPEQTSCDGMFKET